MTALLRDLDAYIRGFADFVTASPTSYHAANAVAAQLATAGFTPHAEDAAWDALSAGSSGFVVRDGAVIAWRAGSGLSATSPVRVLGVHTDSPGFVLKPHPDFRADGWAQAGVEVYGGPLLNSWLDRDLGIAGRIVTRNGIECLVQTGAVARIPQLAIHLDREANTGLALNKQRHVQPVLAVGDSAEGVSVAGLLSEASRAASFATADGASETVLDGCSLGFAPDEIAGADVRLFDTQPPQRIGASGEFFASPRLDNLSSTYAGLVALLETDPAPGTISVLAAFDHEELGSETRSGAAGPFLADVLGRLRASLGATRDEEAQASAASWCISADAGHSVHPNYPEKHDPNVRPLAGRGPMLKINANQRYASDAHGAALWGRACAAAEVPTQEFVSNNTVPCGSTIGPITATRLGIRTVDVGVPLLSMHSARELAHVADLHGLARATGAFFAGA
ncbi:aspartyl aminopeptidase [Leucobacter luti]|uniref:M18 family aminopeptidase n=1 Tax=Leucobacter luti TaxID=340320 RepID=A0A4R6S7H5_9MICO|nr:M18 family aminopeptidase [Leucobacter luti]MCW2288698.1 aspartyl aminopeptidase [Leucobacter luti]TCK45147.1 aspartyl aminopeptidase [Leucobacter luti]TDP95671.1 aspartyl aminopeptidase [Leucobacter luti]